MKSERKDCFVIIRVTGKLKDKINLLAERTDQSVSEFVRDLILGFFHAKEKNQEAKR